VQERSANKLKEEEIFLTQRMFKGKSLEIWHLAAAESVSQFENGGVGVADLFKGS